MDLSTVVLSNVHTQQYKKAAAEKDNTCHTL